MAVAEPRRSPVDHLEVPCRSALNRVEGMRFKWTLNPYTGCEHRCAFCYVRGYELRAGRPFDERYGRAIRVKVNIAAVLASELGRRGWKGEGVVVGTATDPYQPAEGRYRLTRSCLEVFAGFSSPVEVITRGPMIVRDTDLLAMMAGRGGVVVNFSIPTLDTEVWRITEPGTAHPRQRLRALEKLVAAGVRAGVAMAPILPHLSDRREQIEEVVRAARAAGATHLWAGSLNLRDGTRDHFLEVLAKHWPELLPAYREAYRDRGYLPVSATRSLGGVVDHLRARHGIADRRRLRKAPAPRPEQMTLLPA